MIQLRVGITEKTIFDYILVQCHIAIPPENVRKPMVS